MHAYFRGVLAAAIAAAASGCGFALRPVVMNAPPADWAALDGTVITGRLVSVCEDGVRTLSGRWRVTRRDRPVR